MKINTSPVTHMLVPPNLDRNRNKYRKFFEGEGFQFAPDCKDMIDKDCPKTYVFLVHEDRGLTKIEVA